MTGTIAVLNGPNLNLLGVRKPEVYGRDTLADVEALCAREAERFGLDVDCRQSNHEGVIIDAVHELRSSAVGFVVNAGACHRGRFPTRVSLRRSSGAGCRARRAGRSSAVAPIRPCSWSIL